MNKYLIIAGIFLLSIVSMQTCQLKRASEKIDRLSTNFTEMQEDNKQLNLTVQEFKEYSSVRMDSILKVASIKPKWIKEYTSVYHNYYDTIVKEVPVEKISTTKYNFLETSDCFTVGGTIDVKDTVPKLSINYRKFTDSLDIIKYLEPKKFLFIKSYLFGKDEELKIIGNCGEYKYEHINIVKR